MNLKTLHKSFALFTSILVFFAMGVLAQERSLTSDEFVTLWRAAMTKARGLNRRVVSTRQHFTDGKPSETEVWKYEYDGRDRVHYTNTLDRGDKHYRTEEIDMGKVRYCKKADGVWQEVTSPCIGGGIGGATVGTSKYSVEKAKLNNRDVDLYHQYTFYKDRSSPTRESEGLSFDDWKFWLTREGLVVREEYVHGLVDSKIIKWSRVEISEFDPTIKVEAPIPVSQTPPQ